VKKFLDKVIGQKKFFGKKISDKKVFWLLRTKDNITSKY
jgi:hypothetical protein